jgi:two-component system chemotaxis sensor kinase CheA
LSAELQKKLLEAFDSEHRTVLTTIRAYLMKLEASLAGTPDEGPPGNLDEAFRMAHSLKGAARVVDLLGVVALAHRLETVFASVRDQKLALDLPSLRVLHSVLDSIEDLVSASKKGETLEEPVEGLKALDGLIAQRSATPNARSAPPEVVSPSPKPAPAQSESLRLSAEHLDGLLRTAGELIGSIRGSELMDVSTRPLRARVSQMEKELHHLRRHAGRPLQFMETQPELKPVLGFLNLLENEIRALSRELATYRAQGRQNAWILKLLSEKLQQDVLRARMVPAETVFEGFSKMVRDLGAELGKRIEFRTQGLEVEADRVVLQAMKTPLMHMIRNSISHGIESPEDRKSRGKDPVGRILLHIQNASGRLRITLKDDGGGIDNARVAQTAIARGLLTPEAAASLGPRELSQFIFQAGFSTAPELTDLSGRGMGLSVVYESIKKLQGEILLEGSPGIGTHFILDVPIAISSHHLILVECGGVPLGLPNYGVESLRKLEMSELKTVEGRSVIFQGGEPIPLVSLAAVIGLAEPTVTTRGDHVSVALLKSGGRRLAVAVDAILDEREALIQELGEPLNRLRHLAGSILMGDGSVAMVLDPAELVRSSHLGSGLQSLLRVAGPDLELKPLSPKRMRILVVDDSITTRTLEKGILEANGYEVGLAVDGLEALEMLQHQTYDLIISDVEMPRMDGFGFVTELKKNPRLAKLPVIMVTSREDVKDQERGLTLGADAYLIKQRFDQAKLLEAIRQIL